MGVDILVQVLVDIATPPEAFQAVDAAVTAHFAANPGEFTGNHIVVANFASDPLKYTLCVWWEFSHPGASLPSAYVASSTASLKSFACVKRACSACI